MPLSADRKAQFEEAFEIIGKKATEIERMDVGIIIAVTEPTKHEVKELFEKVAGGESSIPLEKMLKVADEFETRMKASDQTTVLRRRLPSSTRITADPSPAAELRHVIETRRVGRRGRDGRDDEDGRRGRCARAAGSHTSTPPIAHSLSAYTLLLREQATESSITTNSCRCCWAARTRSRRPSRYPTI